MENPPRPSCPDEHEWWQVNKYGKHKSGLQQYRCHPCRRNFIWHPELGSVWLGVIWVSGELYGYVSCPLCGSRSIYEDDELSLYFCHSCSWVG